MTLNQPEAAILNRVRAIVSDVVGDDTVTIDLATTAADVDGWDSLANVQIFVAIERAYGFRFRTGEMTTIASVGALVQRITERLGAG